MLDEFAFFFMKKADYLGNTDFYWMILRRNGTPPLFENYFLLIGIICTLYFIW